MSEMLILSFLIGYPIFMLSVYIVGKRFFPNLEKVAADQKMEKMILLQKARRVRRVERLKMATRHERSVTITLGSEKLISHQA